ncbi:recombinase family protein [Corynebacterium afermentans]
MSRLTDESTSLERQRELFQKWADQNGHEVVAWAEDVDVSGSVSPFDAPDLGKYLTEDGAREWDVLAAWKLDRLARKAINMNKLFEWIRDSDNDRRHRVLGVPEESLAVREIACVSHSQQVVWP